MMIRLLVTGAFGLSATLLGADFNAPLTTNQAEACGVKVSVKAAPSKRNVRRVAKRNKPINRKGSRVAVRTRVKTKSERTPVAAGADRQARKAKPTVNRPKRKPKLRASDNEKTTPPKRKPAPKAKPDPKPEPKEPETKIAKVDPEPAPKTAPEPKKPDPAPAKSAVTAELYFDTGVFELDGDGEAELEQIVEWLKANPKGKVVIEGHTDPDGSTARNHRLSIKRASAVRAFLSSAAEVPRERFKVKGYGETKLRYPRNSPKNRRVLVKTR